MKFVLLVLTILFCATASTAGPLDDLLGEMSGLRGVAWWMEFVAVVSTAIAFVMAALPQGEPGSSWDKVRTLLNYFGNNWGNAKNIVNKG